MPELYALGRRVSGVVFAPCGACDNAWRCKENRYGVGKWEERDGLGQPNGALEESVWVGRMLEVLARGKQ